MNLEELLDCSYEKLAAMSDAELEAHFAPYFNITRPEMARRKPSTSMANIDPEMQKRLKMAAELGIDINALKKKLNKK